MDFKIPLTVHPLGFATPEEEAMFVSLPDMKAISAMNGNTCNEQFDLHLSTKLLQMQRAQGKDVTCKQNRTEQRKSEQNWAEQNLTEQNRNQQSIIEQSRREQRKTEESRAEQNRTEQN